MVGIRLVKEVERRQHAEHRAGIPFVTQSPGLQELGLNMHHRSLVLCQSRLKARGGLSWSIKQRMAVAVPVIIVKLDTSSPLSGSVHSAQSQANIYGDLSTRRSCHPMFVPVSQFGS